MTELNPLHPVTSGLHGQWHKLLAVVLWKHRDELPGDVCLTAEDFKRLDSDFGGGMPSIVAHEKSDGLHLRVVTEGEARRLAREQAREN